MKPKKQSRWNQPGRKMPSPQSIAALDRARAEKAYRESRGVPLARLIRVPILVGSPHVPPLGSIA